MAQELWNSLAERAGLQLGAEQVQSLQRYLDLLEAANQRMNLTRIVDRAQAEVLHVGDALTLLPHLPQPVGAPAALKIADVGSGGGVPGVVLAIARPDIEVVLIESTKKKADFLAATVKELKVVNASVESRRAEDVGRSSSRQSFDVVAARAVGTLDVLLEWLLPLAKVGGVVLAMKGPKGIEELKQAEPIIGLLGGKMGEAIPAGLQAGLGHLIIKIPKVAGTPPKYPRDPSVAKGSPLRR
jgi:16S rRNA (guanine527-N7)-methyltransferase